MLNNERTDQKSLHPRQWHCQREVRLKTAWAHAMHSKTDVQKAMLQSAAISAAMTVESPSNGSSLLTIDSVKTFEY